MAEVSLPEFAGTGLTVAAFRGAGYVRAPDMAATVAGARTALAAADRALVYAYHGALDRAAHLAGPGSPAWLDAAAEVNRLVERLVEGLPADAALLVTGDHGAIPVGDDDKIDLDACPGLHDGVTLIAGEARVRYVHTRPDATPDVLAAWRQTLGDRAMVLERDEAVAAGWYGPVAPRVLPRIGDIVAVATGRTALVRRTAVPDEAALAGYHGALTAAEMRVPLLVYR